MLYCAKKTKNRRTHCWLLITVLSLTINSCITCTSYFTSLSLNMAFCQMKNQVRGLFNSGFLLAFMFVGFVPKVRMCVRPPPLSPRAPGEDTGREAQTWMQPYNPSQRRAPDDLSTSHLLKFSCNRKSIWSCSIFTGWTKPEKSKLPTNIRKSLCWKVSSRPALALLLNLSLHNLPGNQVQ